MNICFVLPIFTRQPQGGYKMVFEYANRLERKGHNVTIMFINENALSQFRVPDFFRKIGAKCLTQIEPRWFKLNPSIIKVSGWGTKLGGIGVAIDICVATSIDTIEFVKKHFQQCKKVHFIQGHENWICDESTVNKAYELGWAKIVVSEWLAEKVNQYSPKPACLIKNPIDLSMYQNTVRQEERIPHSISMLYHTNKHKGVKYAIEALHKLKGIYPDLTVEMFGIFDRPTDLPDWFNYTQGASLKQTVEIYNKTQVYLCATVAEGYGLTGLEAMACGAALVSTDYQGVHEYATNGYNALLSPIKDIDALVANVCKVLDNDNLRYRLVQNSLKCVHNFSWDLAVDKFLNCLERI